MKVLHVIFSILTLAATALTARAIEATATLDLWPAKPPGFQVEGTPEHDMSTPGKDETGGKPVIRLTNVSKPQLVVYAPPKEKAVGTIVVVCPGGGWRILAWDLEGTEIAEWLNSIGVTAAVLKYRTPTFTLKEKKWEPPVQDAQRAISLIRSKSAEWGINPDHVGALGFSAGGTTAGMATIKNGTRLYDAQDDIDKLACNANFGVLIYPSLFWDDKEKKLGSEIEVSTKTPPIFFAQAADDKLSCENSIQVYLALKHAGVVGSELHIYESGGHGFGTRDKAKPCTSWPQRCAEWMEKRGMLKK